MCDSFIFFSVLIEMIAAFIQNLINCIQIKLIVNLIYDYFLYSKYACLKMQY